MAKAHGRMTVTVIQQGGGAAAVATSLCSGSQMGVKQHVARDSTYAERICAELVRVMSTQELQQVVATLKAHLSVG
jgi:hypothetical protein